jgi:hypothetical protein
MSKHDISKDAVEVQTEPKRKKTNHSCLPPPDLPVDAEVWASLPDDIKTELLIEHLQQVEANSSSSELSLPMQMPPQASGSASSSQPSKPDHIDASTWCSLPSEIKRELATFASTTVLDSSPYASTSPISMGIRIDPLIAHMPSSSAQDVWLHSLPSNEECSSSLSTPVMTSSASSTLSSLESWKDPDFPPSVSSIDGIESNESHRTQAPRCGCGKACRMNQVRKENQNQGRMFFTCPLPKGTGCNFFKWEDGERGHAKKDVDVKWKRLTIEQGYKIVGSEGFNGKDVCQGAVGDCWFMSVRLN